MLTHSSMIQLTLLLGNAWHVEVALLNILVMNWRESNGPLPLDQRMFHIFQYFVVVLPSTLMLSLGVQQYPKLVEDLYPFLCHDFQPLPWLWRPWGPPVALYG
uniref:Uncharacterized protein n=1 Tax=Trieres chinensis TaxID=1514140 RepID=A0A7S1ZF38_TRICV|mmetsp:Transcript_24282/g.49193  ORF Transcript_24282/g.49193 Transcript_24282/m.49193 type:complete len:103 (+) Transcript_24282:105-413(+)